MAANILNVQTPVGSNGMTVVLSENTRAIAHASLKYKVGYLTISRYNDDTGKWRNVHIAKKSVEKLKESAPALLEAHEKKKILQIPLTKRQFVMTTKYQQRNMIQPRYYITILHPKIEQDSIVYIENCFHAKTINLKRDEFEKLYASLDKLYKVMITPPDSDSANSDIEDSPPVTGYRWFLKHGGAKSNMVFLSKEDCVTNVKFYIQDHLSEDSNEDVQLTWPYEIETMEVRRPSKIEILEHVYYNKILDNTEIPRYELMVHPPSKDTVESAESKVTRSDVLNVATTIASMLNHKRLYLLNEIYDVFEYINGKERIKEVIEKHLASPSGKVHSRLMDSCYENVTVPLRIAHKEKLARAQEKEENKGEEEKEKEMTY